MSKKRIEIYELIQYYLPKHHFQPQALLTLFHAGSDTTYSTRGGGGIYAPPMISRKKKVFAQFLLHTLRATKNRVTHQKAGLYLKKQKNGGRFKIAVCNMTGRISSIFCIFYLFALKWL